ncbi:RDD family protein [Halarcobacter sp.]|uniref:RDD family protein n=1 Tax=Halarcobacter sp. TaxID=2321133 RepID=UPI003B00B1C6
MANRWRDIKQGKSSNEANNQSEKLEQANSPCASLSSRLKAFLTDLFLITTPIFYIVIYLIMGSGEEFAQNRGNGWIIILGVNLLIIVSFWLFKGQTPGLKAYGLKLVNNGTLDKINIFQALLRYILTLFSIITIILMFFPYLRKDRKTFQDVFSNTLIIDE